MTAFYSCLLLFLYTFLKSLIIQNYSERDYSKEVSKMTLFIRPKSMTEGHYYIIRGVDPWIVPPTSLYCVPV
ncbi:hypothetical protein BGW37DRAFT_498392 [Umbelopsis sp. PMI_123]|nr:hypothetical protein BGW37DRAFT_498392 [Umbelopsis sp. PMI_123]